MKTRFFLPFLEREPLNKFNINVLLCPDTEENESEPTESQEEELGFNLFSDFPEN